MKILFIITQSEIGGAQRFLLEFAPYLVSRGHEVLVVAGEGDDELFRRLDANLTWTVPVKFNGDSPRHIKIPSLVRSLNPIKDLQALFALYKTIKKEKPDALFLQSTKAGFLGSLAVKLYQILNTRYQIHVIYRIGGWSFRDPRSWWMNKILFWMEKISAPLKDNIIVNSELDRQLAIDKKIAPAEKIVKVYNGTDPDALNFLPKEKARGVLVSSIEYLVSGKETKIVGTIANLYATKGLECLAEAANSLYQIPDTRYQILFIVIGEGKQRPQLEALIEKYNLQDKFFLVGRMPDASEYLKAFDVFVLPSVKEGFPWVLLEAMAAEVPMVATKVGAVPEIIEDGKEGFLVQPKDSAALAEKISRLLSQPFAHDREQMVVNARKKLRQFSLQKMLEKSEEIINDLAR